MQASVSRYTLTPKTLNLNPLLCKPTRAEATRSLSDSTSFPPRRASPTLRHLLLGGTGAEGSGCSRGFGFRV